MLTAHLCSASKVNKWRVDQVGADTSIIRKKHEWNFMAGKEELIEKLWDMEGNGEKAMGTNTSGIPGYQSQYNSLETQLIRKWGDIGHQWAVSPRIYTTK